MVPAFWILAGLDGVALLALLFLGLNQRGHNDGGREMGLLFFVILPLVVLGVACLAFWLIPATAVRWLLLALLAAPGAFYAYVGIAQLGLGVVNDPANGYSNPAMRDTIRAVARLDVEGVRRFAPNMDKDIDQSRVDAPLRMVMESMLNEIKTRLHARTERHLEIVKILLENGAKPNETLEIACWTKSGPLLQVLFAHGADPNFVNQYGGSAFLSCLGGGMVVGSALPMAKAFVEAGAEFKEKTQYGTPLAFATGCENYDVALYLLEKGADPMEEGFREAVLTKLKTPSAEPHPAALLELSRIAGLEM